MGRLLELKQFEDFVTLPNHIWFGNVMRRLESQLPNDGQFSHFPKIIHGKFPEPMHFVEGFLRGEYFLSDNNSYRLHDLTFHAMPLLYPVEVLNATVDSVARGHGFLSWVQENKKPRQKS